MKAAVVVPLLSEMEVLRNKEACWLANAKRRCIVGISASHKGMVYLLARFFAVARSGQRPPTNTSCSIFQTSRKVGGNHIAIGGCCDET